MDVCINPKKKKLKTNKVWLHACEWSGVHVQVRMSFPVILTKLQASLSSVIIVNSNASGLSLFQLDNSFKSLFN